MVWYSDFGEQFFGKLDPRTGKVTEYPVPLLKKDTTLRRRQSPATTTQLD